MPAARPTNQLAVSPTTCRSSTEARAHPMDNETARSLFSSRLKLRREYLNLKLFHSYVLNNVRVS